MTIYFWQLDWGAIATKKQRFIWRWTNIETNLSQTVPVCMQLTYWVMPWSIENMHFSYTIYDYFVYPDYTLRVCKANMHWYGECSLIMYTVCVRYRKYCKRIFGCFQLPLLVPISWDLSLFGHELMKWARDPSTWSSDFTLPHWTCSFVCNFNTIESIQSCSHFGALNLSCTLPSLSY